MPYVRVAIASDGFRGRTGNYKGMNFNRGENYVASLHLRHDGRSPGPVTISLENQPNGSEQPLARRSRKRPVYTSGLHHRDSDRHVTVSEHSRNRRSG